jgi:hypothetical protein
MVLIKQIVWSGQFAEWFLVQGVQRAEFKVDPVIGSPLLRLSSDRRVSLQFKLLFSEIAEPSLCSKPDL